MAESKSLHFFRQIKFRRKISVGKPDFSSSVRRISAKPCIIIATPGRLIHHLAEVDGMSLHTVEYVVFYEVDSLSLAWDLLSNCIKYCCTVAKPAKLYYPVLQSPRLLLNLLRSVYVIRNLCVLMTESVQIFHGLAKLSIIYCREILLLRGILLTGLHNPKALEAFGKISSCEHVLFLTSSHIGQHLCTCSSMDKQWSFSSRLPSVPFFQRHLPYLKEGFFSKGLVKHCVHQVESCLPSHVNVLLDESNEFPDYACLFGNLLEAAGVTLSKPNYSFDETVMGCCSILIGGIVYITIS